MGAGTNVQDRLVALHHVDVNWKPSDIEQREGRIIRQGNLLLEKYGDEFEVEVAAYATERTYDAKMWSLNETKGRFINGLRAYKGEREVEIERAGGDDVDVLDHPGIAEAHHGTLAKLPFDLAQCGAQRLLAIVIHGVIPVAVEVGVIIPQFTRPHRRMKAGTSLRFSWQAGRCSPRVRRPPTGGGSHPGRLQTGAAQP